MTMRGASDASPPEVGGGIAAVDERWRGQWHGALRRYLVAVAVGNLVWELLQMPLYTIWRTGSWGEIIFAAVHCTGGDILIALSSLTIALLLLGNSNWPTDRFRAVAALTILLGVLCTVFGEYLNVVIRAAWAYSDLMPVVSLFGFELGISPLLQWIAIPTAAFIAVHRGVARESLTPVSYQGRTGTVAATHSQGLVREQPRRVRSAAE